MSINYEIRTVFEVFYEMYAGFLDRVEFLFPNLRFLSLMQNPCCETTRIYENENMSVDENVKQIIVEQLGVNPDEVTPEASFIDDLGADSLDTVELVMAFEEEFNAEIPDEEAEKLRTVGDAIKYIEERMKANA